MTAQLSDGMGGAFAMLPLEPDGPLLLAALRDGELYPRDLAVLWALVARLDWRSGRAWVSRQDLAQAIGHDRTKTVNGSLARIGERYSSISSPLLWSEAHPQAADSRRPSAP